MSTLYAPSARRIWSLSNSGIGTTISAGGDSGEWTGIPNAESAVDLRDVTDVNIMIFVGAVTTSPTMKVGLDLFDDLGNLYPNVLQTAAITGTGAVTLQGGLHGASSAYLVLPAWGRVNWSSVSGGSFSEVEIAVFGR